MSTFCHCLFPNWWLISLDVTCWFCLSSSCCLWHGIWSKRPFHSTTSLPNTHNQQTHLQNAGQSSLVPLMELDWALHKFLLNRDSTFVSSPETNKNSTKQSKIFKSIEQNNTKTEKSWPFSSISSIQSINKNSTKWSKRSKNLILESSSITLERAITKNIRNFLMNKSRT